MKVNKTEVTRLTPEEKKMISSYRNFTQSTTESQVNIQYIERVHNEGELWFVLPDAHYPFQDEALLRKVRNCIKDNTPDGVVLSGDWLDLFTLGSYNADSLGLLRDITLSDEYKSGFDGIKALDKVLTPGCKKVFIYGNHEDRYFRELMKRDNGKYGGELKNPSDALKLDKYGYEVLTNWKDDFFTII